MPTVQRPRVAKFRVDKIEPVDVERRLNSDGDGWEYRARSGTATRWSFWNVRTTIEHGWSITLPPDPEIPEPRVTMPVEVYDSNGAITISDEEVRIHAYDLRVGDELRAGPIDWVEVIEVGRLDGSIRFRVENTTTYRHCLPGGHLPIRIVE